MTLAYLVYGAPGRRRTRIAAGPPLGLPRPVLPPRAGEICARQCGEYGPLPPGDAIRAELEEYVIRRRAGLGD